MICCSCGKEIDINYGREYWNGIYCKKCADEMLSTSEYIKNYNYKRIIADLQAENAALRERLEKAVELPCSVGTTVYGVGFFDCEDAYTEDKKKKREIFNYCMKMNGDCEKCKYRRPSIEEFVCTHIQIGACGLGGQKILIVGEKNENYTVGNIYLTREAALARLAELKGGGV